MPNFKKKEMLSTEEIEYRVAEENWARRFRVQEEEETRRNITSKFLKDPKNKGFFTMKEEKKPKAERCLIL